MTRLTAAFLVLVAIFGASLTTSHWLDGMTEDFIAQLEEAESLALSDQWAEATSLTETTCQQWEDNHFPLHALMRHSETDEIQISFHQVLEYLEQEDENLYAAANGQLITQLELLAEMEHPSWENVL